MVIVMAEINLIKRCLAELIGTFVLVFLGTGTVVSVVLYGQGIDTAGVLAIGLTFGLAIAVMAYVFGHISGTHINPAVSIAMWATRRLPAADAIAYMASQLLGATLASLAVVALFGTRSVDTRLGATVMGTGIEYWQAILIEAITTFMLVLAIMGTAVDKRAPQGLAGLTIGVMASLCIVLGFNATGGSLNPARTFGPYLVDVLAGGANYWWQFPIYLVGPVAGAVAAAFLYDYIADLKAKPAEKVAAAAHIKKM
jgi:glycerol uptake facilitator protein